MASFALELPLYLLLKNSIKRARPADRLTAYINAHIVPSDQFSLPSGHTAGAFVFAACLAMHFPVAALPAYFWAAAIGLSRIMLGVHFPLDVIAGVILGSACCAVAYFIII
ncbi:phosphatase PAP2 family protein [Rheinheimera maricola]|uniref:phosphatase PAP2 family protein n=1 Tax=Rheinheimera maricola TaxID=2793282 RepID=UPI001FD7B81D|nr:phosphatase PAP2 family protein [Rheinheimera maricola]